MSAVFYVIHTFIIENFLKNSDRTQRPQSSSDWSEKQ